MVIREGYKRTEAGVIPEDWECMKIGKIADICMCKRIFSEQTGENFEIPFYKIGTFGKKADTYIPRKLFEEYRRKYSYPKEGDVLLSASGTLGRTVVFDGKDAYFQDSNIVWLDINKDILCNQFLNHFYKVIKWASWEGTTISRLYNGIIRDTYVVVPPMDEQKEIADALSDADHLISSLKKLIAKKKAVRQGAMQELLTGKRRLPGFSGEWETRPLEDYCTLITKQTGFDYTSYIKPALVKQKLLNTLPMIQTINFSGRKVSFDTDYFIPENVAAQFPGIILETKCVLFSIVGASVGNIGLYPGGRAFCGGAIGITRFKDESDVEWVFYYMNSSGGQRQIQYVTKGGAQATLTIADIRKFSIPTPGKREREEIVSVLSAMDAEIQKLEQKLEKYRQIRQGMMQELLTGKIRLV